MRLCKPAVLGPFTSHLELLTAIRAPVPVERFLPPRHHRGRRRQDRAALATAFLAKAVLNLPTTRDLIDRLQADPALRPLRGWRPAQALPHESQFSRAFAEFTAHQLPQLLHEAVVARTQADRLVGHIARAKAGERGTRLQRQRHQSLPTVLAELPTQCDIGVKKSSLRHLHYWRGYKLHLDVADGRIPISAVLTSASVHDSQVAIPLIRMTSQRVAYCYDLMDSAYDADPIHPSSRQHHHVPIIAPHPRRGTRKPSACPEVRLAQPAPELSWAQRERFKERTMSEQVNARLKDELGASQIRVRGAVKVMAHLMFAVVALMVDQRLKLISP